jgi:hypothetical protein
MYITPPYHEPFWVRFEQEPRSSSIFLVCFTVQFAGKKAAKTRVSRFAAFAPVALAS